MITLKLLLFIEVLQLQAFVIFYLCLNKETRHLLRPLDLATALAIPVVGLFGQDKNVFYAVMFAIPLLSIGKPSRLACRYLLALPLFPALGENYLLHGQYLGEFSAIGAYNLGALTALALTKGRARSVAAIDFGAWIFFVVSLVMDVRGVPPLGVLRSVFTTFLEVVPPFYIVARLIRTPRIASDATLFFALGGFCNAVIAIFETRRGWPLYQGIYQSLHISTEELSATLSIRAGLLRAQGAVANNTSLGLILALGLIAMMASRGRFRPAGRSLIMAMLVVGLLACQSRGSWIAAAVGVALYLLYEGRTAALGMFATGAAAAGVAIVAIAPAQSRLGQLVGRSGHAQSTAEYRSNLLYRGLQEIATHPLAGQTRAQLQVTMNDMRQGQHIIDFVNTHLAAALTGGISGFALWISAWITPLIVGWRMRRSPASRLEQSPIALPFAMIGACFTCLIFTSAIDRITSLVLLSTGMMSAFVQLAKSRDQVEGAERAALLARVRPDRVPQSA